MKNSPIDRHTAALTLAGVLARIIGFFYRPLLSRPIGAEGLGIYQLLSPVTGARLPWTRPPPEFRLRSHAFVSSRACAEQSRGCEALFSDRPAAVAVFILPATGFVVWKYAELYRCFHAARRMCGAFPAPEDHLPLLCPLLSPLAASTAATMDRKRRASPLSHSSQSRSPASARCGCSVGSHVREAARRSALRHNVGRCDGRSGKHARLRQRRKTSEGNGHGAFREMRHAQSPCHGGSAHGKPGCFNALFQF